VTDCEMAQTKRGNWISRYKTPATLPKARFVCHRLYSSSRKICQSLVCLVPTHTHTHTHTAYARLPRQEMCTRRSNGMWERAVWYSFGGTYCLYLQGRRVKQADCLAYSLTLKMEALLSPKCRCTRRHFPEDEMLCLLWRLLMTNLV
jgi:hypothetical protein